MTKSKDLFSTAAVASVLGALVGEANKSIEHGRTLDDQDVGDPRLRRYVCII